MELDFNTMGGPFDAGHTPRPAEYSEAGVLQKVANRQREFAKPVFQIPIESIELRFAARGSNLLVNTQPVQLFVDEIRRNFQIDPEVDRGLHLGQHFTRLEFLDRSFEHLTIEIKTDGLDV